MIRSIILMAALAVAAPAAADPDRLSILLGSAHPGDQIWLDGRNPCLFLTWEGRRRLDLTAGLYRNSYGRASVAATAALPVIAAGLTISLD